MHRPNVLVFEWLCGGGLYLDGAEPAGESGLLDQGRRMLSALCEDFLAAGCDPFVPVDSRLGWEFPGSPIAMGDARTVQQGLVRLASRADSVLVIAPETGGCLARCLERLAAFSGKTLNPNVEFTRLASDKNRLQSFLAERGVPVPAGDCVHAWLSTDDRRDRWPLVLKPGDGCGGEGQRMIRSREELEAAAGQESGDWRVEEFVLGTAASVSVIVSPNAEPLFLPPLRQIFDRQPIGKFVRCDHDLPPCVAGRATQLARQTVSALPATLGYFGIDMVIGAPGLPDVVIEVNPRMTMSYCCLREFVDFNLAAKMLEGRWAG